MNRFVQYFAVLVFTMSGVLATPAVRAALVDDLQDGRHVLLMRHADAPGIGDPPGYVVSNCATQRNLGDYGKKQAKAIGIWLTKQGIQTARVLSSPWCRCLDTANALNKGEVITAPALGSFFDDMSLEKSQTQKLAALIKQELAQKPKGAVILVTHHVNIQAYTEKIVNVGDMVLVKVDENGGHLSHTVYPSPKP
ncbi:MAG: histidine phosphatase family protein [Betaproteobacteria bacterium]